MAPERPYRDLTEEELAAATDEAEKALADFRRKPRRYRSDAHKAADLVAEGARQRVRQLLKDHVYALSRGDTTVVTGLGDLLAFTQPSVLALQHKMIDEIPAGTYSAGETFGPLDRPEAEEKTLQLRHALAAYEREARWRSIDRQKAHAEEEEQRFLAAEGRDLTIEAEEMASEVAQ